MLSPVKSLISSNVASSMILHWLSSEHVCEQLFRCLTRTDRSPLIWCHHYGGGGPGYRYSDGGAHIFLRWWWWQYVVLVVSNVYSYFSCAQNLIWVLAVVAWNVDGDADVDDDGGDEHHIDMLRSSGIPSEAIVVDAARNCVTSLGRSKAQKAFSLSRGLSDAQTTGFTLSSGKITQILNTKYFQPHERLFLWLHVLPKLRHRQNLLS